MIETNADEFDAYLLRVETKGIEEWFLAIMRKIALDLHGRLVRATPVDTGRARFGWDISVSTPSSFSPLPGAESYGPFRHGEPPSGEEVARALGALATLRYGDEIWIVNNTVYIKRLNEGWSDQQPAGFVEAALQALEQVLKQAA